MPAEAVMEETQSSAVSESRAVSNPNRANVPDAKSERNAVVLALFGPSVGPCAGDFATTYNRVNGRLYAATKAILFYSNLFGFERRLCLQLADIETIEAYRSTSIRISMIDCEDHVFRKFQNRETVLLLLHDLLYRESANTATSRTLSFSKLKPEILEIQESTEEPLRPHFASEITLPPSETSPAARRRAHSVPSLPTPVATQEETNRDNESSFRRTTSAVEPIANEEHETPTASPRPETNTTAASIPPPIPPNPNIARMWEAARQPHSDSALNEVTLSCSLETFMDMFFSNEASYPLSKYQREEIGDREVSYSKWKKRQPPSSPPVFDREVSFIHPLNNAVGPSEAKTTRQQRFQRFGTYGLSLQNVTMVQGVPGAECFRIEDRWIIEGVSDNSVKMMVSFHIDFTKRTMFKPLIQKNIRQETKKWFRGYAVFIQRALREDDKKEAETPGSTPIVSMDPVPSIVDTQVNTFPWGWLVAVLVFFSYLLYQLSATRHDLHSLQEQLATMQRQNDELVLLVQRIYAKEC